MARADEGLLDPKLIDRFFTVRTVGNDEGLLIPQDVETLLKDIETSAEIAWLPVGGLEVNVSAIETGTNPPLQLIERVVNGFDGWLELMKARHPKDNPKNPFEAARLWADMPESGVRGLGDKEKRTLAGSVVRVTMAESGDENRPTVLIQDGGIGIHPDDYARTILSIHGNNKREKPYLHGAFGHGAATTLKFSTYTIIASRLAPDLRAGRTDMVGATVIRFRRPRRNEKFGVYEYLTHRSGSIFRAPAETCGAPFNREHGGVYVAHIEYDLKGYTADYKREKSGLWGLLNSVLFDPALPVQMLGQRRKDLDGDPRASTTGRIAAGNAALLSYRPLRGTSEADGARGAITVLQDSFTLNLNSRDSVFVEWWVLDREAETYVSSDQQLTVTLNGQRHAARSRQWFKQLKFSYLARVMVVHVKADGLCYDSRRKTFSSLREADVKEGYLDQVVLEEIGEYLAQDSRLQDHEDLLHKQDLEKAANKASDALRRRVAQRMERALRGAGFKDLKISGSAGATAGGAGQGTPQSGRTGTGDSPRPPKPRNPRAIPDDSMLKDIPTTLTLDPGPHELRQGMSCQLLMSLDAKNDYLPRHEADLRVEVSAPRGSISFRGASRLLGGKCRLYFRADEACKLGPYGVKVELSTPHGVLHGLGELLVVEPPAKRAPAAANTSGLPEIKWFKREEWPEGAGWTDAEVGDVVESRDTVTIRLNEDFNQLAAALSRRKGNAIAAFKNRYLVSTAVGLWMQEVYIYQKGRNVDEEAMREARRWIAAASIEGIETSEERLEDD